MAAHPEGDDRRVLSVAKFYVQELPGLAFRIVRDDQYHTAKTMWLGNVPFSADELVAVRRDNDDDPGAMDRAIEFLEELTPSINDEPWLWTKEVKDAATAAWLAVSWKTLERARVDLGIRSKKVGRPGDKEQGWRWYWPARKSPGHGEGDNTSNGKSPGQPEGDKLFTPKTAGQPEGDKP